MLITISGTSGAAGLFAVGISIAAGHKRLLDDANAFLDVVADRATYVIVLFIVLSGQSQFADDIADSSVSACSKGCLNAMVATEPALCLEE